MPCRCSSFLIFQSTLPREERHVQAKYMVAMSDFNPRSHERSDDGINGIIQNTMNFNPRSHERSDKYTATLTKTDKISIHAPTRGATKWSYLTVPYI